MGMQKAKMETDAQAVEKLDDAVLSQLFSCSKRSTNSDDSGPSDQALTLNSTSRSWLRLSENTYNIDLWKSRWRRFLQSVLRYTACCQCWNATGAKRSSSSWIRMNDFCPYLLLTLGQHLGTCPIYDETTDLQQIPLNKQGLTLLILSAVEPAFGKPIMIFDLRMISYC
ncbi:hypothetical protein BKA81DRAFT_72506 [Phyllosticta paracitricarpa]